MKLFVPGRICVLGEHSDWAGGYRRINSDIHKGCAIIVGTNQGLHAEVEAHPNRFIVEVPWRGPEENILDLPMDGETLLATAEEGGFFSYACGVAYQNPVLARAGDLIELGMPRRRYQRSEGGDLLYTGTVLVDEPIEIRLQVLGMLYV